MQTTSLNRAKIFLGTICSKGSREEAERSPTGEPENSMLVTLKAEEEAPFFVASRDLEEQCAAQPEEHELTLSLLKGFKEGSRKRVAHRGRSEGGYCREKGSNQRTVKHGLCELEEDAEWGTGKAECFGERFLSEQCQNSLSFIEGLHSVEFNGGVEEEEEEFRETGKRNRYAGGPSGNSLEITDKLLLTDDVRATGGQSVEMEEQEGLRCSNMGSFLTLLSKEWTHILTDRAEGNTLQREEGIT